MNAFFSGIGVRVIAAVLMLAYAIKGLLLPEGPLAVALMMTYLPVLFVETRLLIGYLKHVPTPPTGGPTNGKKIESDAKPQSADDDNHAPCSEALA